MITENKVMELFCIADDFCKFFGSMMGKYAIKEVKKRHYHRDSTLSKAEVMLIMILFHDSGYRCLKHFYQKAVRKQNFVVNMLGALARNSQMLREAETCYQPTGKKFFPS